jgi:hypothetical protein
MRARNIGFLVERLVAYGCILRPRFANSLETCILATFTINWLFNDGNGNNTSSTQQVIVTCSGVGLSESEITTITLYPNPANNNLNIEFTSTVIGEIAIVDVHGKVIKTQLVNGSQVLIQIPELTNGIYFLHFGESVNRFSVIH